MRWCATAAVRASAVAAFVLVAICLVELGSGELVPGTALAQGPTFFVNTTEDMGLDNTQCVPGQVCPLRSAIAKAQSLKATVRACYDPAEVGGALKCPLGAKPLRTSDPNYDADHGKWRFPLKAELGALEVSGQGINVDFSKDVDGWDGPAKNRIVITNLSRDMPNAIVMEGHDNRMAGFDLTGGFTQAAILVRTGFEGTGPTGNQFGPGLGLAEIREGVGIRIKGAQATGNRIVGNWCGLTGDGSVQAGLQEDCIQLIEGASANTVGGPNPPDRNVLAASRLGVGVRVEGGGSRGNVIEGNWIGVDATGFAAKGNQGGIAITLEAPETIVRRNVISGNRGAGISIVDDTGGTVIEDNIIGESPERLTCVGNRGFGIQFQGRAHDTLVRSNRVACNETGGIGIGGASVRIWVTRNSLSKNDRHPLDVSASANAKVQPPVVAQVTLREVRGSACKGCTVEVFSDPASEADLFEGSLVASPTDGTFLFRLASADFTHRTVSLTATDGQNTSGLSPAKVVPRPTGEPSPTPGGPTPTPGPTVDPTAGYSIWLPVLRNRQ